jgi:hypothetical protein
MVQRNMSRSSSGLKSKPSKKISMDDTALYLRRYKSSVMIKRISNLTNFVIFVNPHEQATSQYRPQMCSISSLPNHLYSSFDIIQPEYSIKHNYKKIKANNELNVTKDLLTQITESSSKQPS